MVNCQDLFKVLLKFLNAAHVVLVFNRKSYNLRTRTRTIKLKWTWISVDIIHKKALCLLSQQPATNIMRQTMPSIDSLPRNETKQAEVKKTSVPITNNPPNGG